MDRTWQERLAAFLAERGLSGGFYWCLNCNSGDTVRTAEVLQKPLEISCGYVVYPLYVFPLWLPSFHTMCSNYMSCKLKYGT